MIVSIGIFYLLGEIVTPTRLIPLLSALGLSGCVLAIGLLLRLELALGV